MVLVFNDPKRSLGKDSAIVVVVANLEGKFLVRILLLNLLPAKVAKVVGGAAEATLLVKEAKVEGFQEVAVGARAGATGEEEDQEVEEMMDRDQRACDNEYGDDGGEHVALRWWLIPWSYCSDSMNW